MIVISEIQFKKQLDNNCESPIPKTEEMEPDRPPVPHFAKINHLINITIALVVTAHSISSEFSNFYLLHAYLTIIKM